MARSDWNIEGVLFYVDEEGNQLDIYEYSDMVSPDLPIGHVALLLNLSRQRLVDVLNEPCTSNRHLITNYEESFRYENFIFNRFNVFREYSDVTVELLDFEYWLDDNYSLLKENLAIPKEAHREVQITAKERDFAALKAELEQARQEKAALQTELEKTKAELEKVRQGEGQCLEWYGLIAVVEQCRKEGKTPQETAACLKERGASLAMIGGLMHPQGDIKDWQQYGKDLFNGSTKTLPW